MTQKELQWFLIGLVTLWVIKYMVVGLAAWDGFFHPERFQADTMGPYKCFAKPLLGILG